MGIMKFNSKYAVATVFVLIQTNSILVTEHNGSKEKQFVTQIELTYEFNCKHFGIGPVIGYGLSKDDNHYMVGLRMGKGF